MSLHRTPLCLLSLHFRQAFDRVSHEYLFQVRRRYGISSWFVERLQAMYDQIHASEQINGNLVGPIAIHNGIMQGCPLSIAYMRCTYTLLCDPWRNHSPWHKDRSAISEDDGLCMRSLGNDLRHGSNNPHYNSTGHQNIRTGHWGKAQSPEIKRIGNSRTGRPNNHTIHPIQ